MDPESPPCLDSAWMVSHEGKGFFFSRQGHAPLSPGDIADGTSWCCFFSSLFEREMV